MHTSADTAGWEFWIDRGGTFTDVIGAGPQGGRLVKRLRVPEAGDYAIALALAHFASRMRWVEIAYTPVPDTRHSDPQTGRMGMTADEQDAMNRPWWKEPLGSTIRGHM